MHIFADRYKMISDYLKDDDMVDYYYGDRRAG